MTEINIRVDSYGIRDCIPLNKHELFLYSFHPMWPRVYCLWTKRKRILVEMSPFDNSTIHGGSKNTSGGFLVSQLARSLADRTVEEYTDGRNVLILVSFKVFFLMQVISNERYSAYLWDGSWNDGDLSLFICTSIDEEEQLIALEI